MSTKVIFLKEKKFKNAVLIAGLPGIGLVGKICVDYLLKHLKAEKFAEITSTSFPPSVHTTTGLLELIKDELYYCSVDNQDFIFLSGPVQPSLDVRHGAQEHFEFSESIIAALKEKGLGEVCTLAGINVGDKRMQSSPRVIAAATTKNKLAEWKKAGAITDKPLGLISGAAGLLAGIGKENGIVGSCLMGETSANLVYGDPGAAKKVLELIIKKYGFKVDMNKMDKEAKEIEKTFAALTKQFNDSDSDESKLTYVR